MEMLKTFCLRTMRDESENFFLHFRIVLCQLSDSCEWVEVVEVRKGNIGMKYLTSRFEISELCIFGLSCAIFRRCNLLQTCSSERASVGRKKRNQLV